MITNNNDDVSEVKQSTGPATAATVFSAKTTQKGDYAKRGHGLKP
jgi:hypothetical protein